MSDSPTEPAPDGEEKKDKPNLPPIPEEVREASLRKEIPSKADEKEPDSKAESEQQSVRANETTHCEYTIIGSDGEEYGPVTTEKVNHWITTGQVNGQTLVRTGKESQWRPLGQLPELKAVLSTDTIPDKPGKVTVIAIITLIGGILAVVVGIGEALGVISSLCFACFLIPGAVVSFFGGIFMIVQGALLLGQDPARHLRRTRISASLQIACILAGDVVNLIFGILNHVFLSDRAVVDYRKKITGN